MTLPGLPGALPIARRCRECHRKVRGALYDGLGPECARKAGLVKPKLRLARSRSTAGSEGSGLLAFLPDAGPDDDEPDGEPEPTTPQTCTDSDERDPISRADI